MLAPLVLTGLFSPVDWYHASRILETLLFLVCVPPPAFSAVSNIFAERVCKHEPPLDKSY